MNSQAVCRTMSWPARVGVVMLAVVLLTLAFSLTGRAEGERKYVLATANIAGTYYPVGVALATLTKIKLEPGHGLSLTAVRSAGSAENLELMRKGEAQFAILQGLYGSWAWEGKGQFAGQGPQANLRSITMLWQNVEHFIVQSDYVQTGTVTDLENLTGKRASLGQGQSGSIGSSSYILASLGWEATEDFELVDLTYNDSADAIRRGDIQVMSIPGGPPVTAVARAFSALGKDIRVLDFTEEQVGLVNRRQPLWSEYVIEANTYQGQDRPIRTIAQPNFLAVNADIGDEDVYYIVKTIYNNLDFLHNIHPVTAAMQLEEAISGLPVPLHPGAARYYREMGVEIPDALISR